MADISAMHTPTWSPTGILRVWILDVRRLVWAWSVWIIGFIVSTIACRLLLDPYDTSKTWPFELWYGLHVVLGAVCTAILWRGTRHIESRLRRLGILAIHAALGFIVWIALVIAAFWSGFLPFIE